MVFVGRLRWIAENSIGQNPFQGKFGYLAENQA
jgi:hypothetical protein